MTIRYKDGKFVEADCIRWSEAIKEMGDALDRAHEALRFYANGNHWMGLAEDDDCHKLLIANGNTREADGPAVARAALKANGVDAE